MPIFKMKTGAMNFVKLSLDGVVQGDQLLDRTLALRFVGMDTILENMDVMTGIYMMGMVVINIVL